MKTYQDFVPKPFQAATFYVQTTAIIFTLIIAQGYITRCSLCYDLSRCYSTQFEKILVANRGEIACRIMRTCRDMGIKSVGVYSDIDATELHVRCADESLCVGEAPPEHSYSNIENIVNAAKQSGAVAIHPGYGFLSQNAQFVKRLEENNIIFIGPPVNAIEVMTNQLEAKKVASQSGVKIIPGPLTEIQTLSQFRNAAKHVGYPLVIKPVMKDLIRTRVVYDEESSTELFEEAKYELSLSQFPNSSLFVEQLIESVRHIEVPILADHHGNMIHLTEKECSVQRNYKKLIDESPAIFATPKFRSEISKFAISIAKSVRYYSAGAVQFLIDSEKRIYFLGMETRIQEGTSVTEALNKIDIVEEMIKIAQGEPLSYQQDQVIPNGYAVQCKVYAEDPVNYIPDPGVVTKFAEPSLTEDLTIESNIVEGSEISIHYDHLLAKVVSYQENRHIACRNLAIALSSFFIGGVKTNIPLLSSILTNSIYLSGKISTDQIYETFPNGFKGLELTDEECLHLGILGSIVYYANSTRTNENFKFSPVLVSSSKVDFKIISIIHDNVEDGPVKITYERNGKVHVLEADSNITCGQIAVQIENEGYYAQIVSFSFNEVVFRFRGEEFVVNITKASLSHLHNLIKNSKNQHKTTEQSLTLKASLPGKVIGITCEEGDHVDKNTTLIAIDAMRKVHFLRNAELYKIKKINCQVGDVVKSGQILIEFTSPSNLEIEEFK